MSTGQLAIRLSSPNWGTGSETLAMAEVTAAPRSGTRGPSVKVPLGVNDAPKSLSLDAGPYLVRLFLPSGDVQAERIEVLDGGLAELNFDIGKSPHEWLGLAAILGIVQTLPSAGEVRLLEAGLSRPAPTIFRGGPEDPRAKTPASFDRTSGQFQDLAASAALSLARSTSELDRISGHDRVAQSAGWRWIHRVNPMRPFPVSHLSPVELARWWTGDPVLDPVRMDLVQSDERNARLMPPMSASGEWRGRRDPPVRQRSDDALFGHGPRGLIDSVWQRLVVHSNALGGLDFSLIGESVRVESTQVQSDVKSPERFIERVIDDPMEHGDRISRATDPILGILLFQLLLPQELKSHLTNPDNTVLVIDDDTARYPWELLTPPSARAADGEVPQPFVVHAGLVRQRERGSDQIRSLLPAVYSQNALIVGAPATGGWKDEQGAPMTFNDLPAARAEAHAVADILRRDSRDWAVTSLISPEPAATVIGSDKPTPSWREAVSFEQVRFALLKRRYRLLHLCGHGVVDQWMRRVGREPEVRDIFKTGMVLSDQEVLGAADVEQMSPAPEFVFINCCYSGRDGEFKHGVDAFGGPAEPARAHQRPVLAASLALKFIAMGSRAVVAAGWEVDDAAALLFAERLYAALLQDHESFGNAVRLARQAVYEQSEGGHNTWGAFQCYGDPSWRLNQAAPGAEVGGAQKGDGARAFAAVRDPVGGTYFGVLPEGWASTSQDRVGQLVAPSVLLSVVIDTAMNSADSRLAPARWRCTPEIDDVEAMSLLGFLHTGQAKAGQMMLERAHTWLFKKTANPVAAAAGAYMLLSHTEEANVQLDPDWRRWVENLYRRFPTVPDGAIAMAQMAMAYGETGRSDEIDVEKLRGYALEAVRRGLPYLGTGVRRLTDVLVALDGDDRAEGRSGALVESTRKALALVRELGRVAVQGEFFTVLRLDEERA